jgi:opacity protein-like surface antigen
MKKLLFASVFACLLPISSKAGSFDGPYVSLGAGAQYTSNSNFSNNVSNDTSDTHFVGQLLAGYSFEITPNFNLATNAFFNLSNDKAGSTSTLKATTKNNIGISFEPGVYLDDKTLVYLKAGYARIDSKLDDGITKTNDSLNGYLYGLGGKYLLSKDIYLGAEFEHYSYGDNTAHLSTPSKYKTEQNQALITIGYKF